MSKPCSKCGETKSLELFSKNSKCAGGFLNICNPCRSIKRKAAYWLAHPGAVAAHIMRAVTPDYKYKAHKQWTQENRDKQRASRAKWASENPGKIKAAARATYLKHAHLYKDARAKYQQEYYALNPHKQLALCRIYQTRKKEALHPLRDDLMIQTIYKASSRISACTGIQHHVDHHMPLSKGGWHHHQNLRIITAKANLSKSAAVPTQVN
jgi:hypothetical protein